MPTVIGTAATTPWSPLAAHAFMSELLAGGVPARASRAAAPSAAAVRDAQWQAPFAFAASGSKPSAQMTRFSFFVEYRIDRAVMAGVSP